MTAFTVRPARVLDARAIAEVNARAWRDRLEGVLPPRALTALAALDPGELEVDWTSSLLNPPVKGQRAVVAVGDDGETVVGYAAFGPSQDPDALPAEYELVGLEVAPEAQRQGHGSRLLAAMADLAGEAGATSAIAWCALDDSVRRAFLQSTGWEPDSAMRDLDAGDGDIIREIRLAVALG